MNLSKTFIKTRNSYKVSFKLPDYVNSEGKEVRVVGDFNDWNWDNAPIMKSVKGGYKIDVELEAGKKYEYRYLIDRYIWVNDEIADQYIPSPFTGSWNPTVSEGKWASEGGAVRTKLSAGSVSVRAVVVTPAKKAFSISMSSIRKAVIFYGAEKEPIRSISIGNRKQKS